jgi:hypothetical protein
MRYFWKFGLKEQKEEKLESEEAIVRRRRRLTAVRSNAPVHEAYFSRSPVLEVFDFRVLANPCCTRIQPYTF